MKQKREEKFHSLLEKHAERIESQYGKKYAANKLYREALRIKRMSIFGGVFFLTLFLFSILVLIINHLEGIENSAVSGLVFVTWVLGFGLLFTVDQLRSVIPSRLKYYKNRYKK
jgi:hypothetical protein